MRDVPTDSPSQFPSRLAAKCKKQNRGTRSSYVRVTKCFFPPFFLSLSLSARQHTSSRIRSREVPERRLSEPRSEETRVKPTRARGRASERTNIRSTRGPAAPKTAGTGHCLLPVDHRAEPNLRDPLARSPPRRKATAIKTRPANVTLYTAGGPRLLLHPLHPLFLRALLFPVCHCSFDKVEG